MHKQVPNGDNCSERLAALQRVAEGWYPLGHGGFFWPARKTSAGPTILGVPDPYVIHKRALPVTVFCQGAICFSSSWCSGMILQCI